MALRSIAPLAASLILACALHPLAADEPAAPSLLDPSAAAPDYDDLIKQLDADQFGDRQAASEKLIKAGAGAIGALERAATSESREARTRAIDILKMHFESNVDSLKTAAKQALERIAAGNNEMASRLAKDILNPKPARPAAVPGGIQIAPGQIQIQVRGIAGGNGRRVRTKIANGVKEIDAQEGDEKVKIVDDPQNGIKMEITQKKDGKETTRKVEAKNADDLKKKDPEAHKLYEKYNNRRGIQFRGIQIQPGGALPIRPGALPRGFRPGAARPVRRIADVRNAKEQLEKATQEFDKALEQVKKAIENDRNADELKQALERLEEVKKQVAEAKEKIAAW